MTMRGCLVFYIDIYSLHDTVSFRPPSPCQSHKKALISYISSLELKLWQHCLLIFFKRDSPTRFPTLSFFHHLNQPGSLTTNQNRKYFNHGQWPRKIRIMKKTRGRKSCCTVPYKLPADSLLLVSMNISFLISAMIMSIKSLNVQIS